MARPARIDLSGYYYHIMSRGQRKKTLFFSPNDRKNFFSFLNELLEDTDMYIYAYCLMGNHYHLLLYRNKYPLSLFMKRLNTNYAVYFNKKYKLVGHVFQGRYKSKIVLNDKYLNALIKYIHANPVESKIITNPIKYKYSSAAFYAGKEEKNIPSIKKVSLYNNTAKDFPVFRNSIGEEKEYLIFEKRKFKKRKAKFSERRASEKNIKRDAKEIAQKLKISIRNIKVQKWNKNIKEKDKEKRIKFIRELAHYGYSYAEIARFLEYNYSTISKLLNTK